MVIVIVIVHLVVSALPVSPARSPVVSRPTPQLVPGTVGPGPVTCRKVFLNLLALKISSARKPHMLPYKIHLYSSPVIPSIPLPTP